jgi:hypothetical protein
VLLNNIVKSTELVDTNVNLLLKLSNVHDIVVPNTVVADDRDNKEVILAASLVAS